MSRPEFALIPTLMFCDYFLTVAGAVLKEQGYDQHFESETYELNPVWRLDINHKRWFNPRDSLLTLSITLFLFLIVESGQLSESFLEGFFGCLCILFGIIIGRHLANIATFLTLIYLQDIDDLEQKIALWSSTYNYLMVAFPVLLIAVFSFSPFMIGAVVAVILIVVLHLVWIFGMQQAKVGNKGEGE